MAASPDQNFVPPPPRATGDVGIDEAGNPLPVHAHPHDGIGTSPTLLNNALAGLGTPATSTTIETAAQGGEFNTLTSPQLTTNSQDESALDGKKRVRDDEAVEDGGDMNGTSPKKLLKRKRISGGGGSGSYSAGGGRNSGPPSSSDNWNDMLFELLKFRAKKGHCLVPKTGPLGRWVARQRLLKPKNGNEGGPMAKEEGVDDDDDDDKPGGDPNATSGPTNAASPSKSSRMSNDEDGQDGSSKRSYLSQDRIDVLESIGFVWDPVQADYDEKWKKRFDELVEFVRVNGHFSVSQTTRKLSINSTGSLVCRVLSLVRRYGVSEY